MSKPKISDYITRIPVTTQRDQTVSFARTLMLQHKIRHLPVMADSEVVGVVSQRDLLLLEAATEDCDELPVERAMRNSPFVVDISSDLGSVAREMAARRIGSAVVTSGGTVVGMFTTTDALSALAEALSE